MKNVLFTISFLFLSFFTKAQCPNNGHAFLWTQASVDAFIQNYPNCSQLISLHIGSSQTPPLITDISDLSGLTNITSVSEYLKLWHNVNLTDLNDLTNIHTVGYLQLSGNTSLTNLSGLEGLTSITHEIDIHHNGLLTSLSGLENVTSVTKISVTNEASLTSLTGLSGITNPSGDIYLRQNNLLSSLDGLHNMTVVGGQLRISNNPILNNLSALANLRTVGNALWFDSNSSLSSLTGLESLITVGGTLTLGGNFQLTDITGLTDLTSVGGLNLTGNFNLPSLSGLENLSFSSAGSLKISSMDALTSLQELNGIINTSSVNIEYNDLLPNLDGLENVATTDFLFVKGNPLLTNIDGLAGLETITAQVLIQNNDILSSIDGIAGTGLNAGGNHILIINFNPLLSVCAVESVCSYLETTGSRLINQNILGCNSVDQVLQSCALTILPVELSNFKLKEKGNQVILDWTTISEEHNKGFEVWKRNDLQDWKNIGWVDGNGTTSTKQDYNYLDERPFRGTNYYKLLQYDFDGKFSESKIAFINIEMNKLVSIYPNPTSEVINIARVNDNTYIDVIRIYDIMGKEMLRINRNERNVNISGLDAGYYMISLKIDGDISNYNFIKL